MGGTLRALLPPCALSFCCSVASCLAAFAFFAARPAETAWPTLSARTAGPSSVDACVRLPSVAGMLALRVPFCTLSFIWAATQPVARADGGSTSMSLRSTRATVEDGARG